jgi:uncharacterized membrane protein YgcG
LYAIVDLHYAAAGSAQSTSREPMADADHASAFWTSVASTFVSDPAILFDLYSAPNVSWSCWQNGCSVSGYTALGMNQLVSAVRATGAKQPLILSGNGVGNDLSGWLANKPSDPSLVAGLQVFETTSCTSATCWNTTVKPVADSVPVVATEVGTSTCNADLPTALMNWADANDQVSYLGWAWVIWSGSDACRDMITNYSGGATTPFGAAFQTHFASRVSSPTPTPTTSTGSTPTPTPTGSQPHNPTPPAVPTPPAPPSGAPSSGGGSTSGGGGSSSGGTGSGSSGGSGSVPAGGLPALPAPPPPPGGDQNNSSASGSIPAPPPPPPPPPLVGVGALAGANIGSADGNPSNSTSSQTGTAGVRSGGGVGSVAGAVAAGAKAIGLPSAVVGFTILELVGSIGAGLILLLLGAALLVIRRQSGQSVAANGSGPTAAPVPITERRW